MPSLSQIVHDYCALKRVGKSGSELSVCSILITLTFTILISFTDDYSTAKYIGSRL